MLRKIFSQKPPFKLEFLRSSSLTSVVNALWDPSTAPNSPRTLGLRAITHCRRKCNASAQPLNIESCDSLSTERPFLFNSSDLPQSVTPFRFDDITASDIGADTTHVQVLEEWKRLLEDLKMIVDSGFRCSVDAVQDVSSIRRTLERHHLVKFLVKPYSYTADDVMNLVPGEPSCGVWETSAHVDKGEAAASKDVDNALISGVNCNQSGDVCDNRQSYINQLEQESLEAVKMLSSDAWRGSLENVVTCDIVDLTLVNCCASRLPSISSDTLLCQTSENETGGKKSQNSKGPNRPTRDQLTAVQDYMADNLPSIFVKFHSYEIYTSDVIFENNWYLDESYVTVGTTSYALEIAKLRLFVHLRFANVKMQLLKITMSEADGTVMVRWRISGIPQMKAIMFWKFLPWKNRSSNSVDAEWLDGFSTFFVDASGLIYKHRMDRVIPDEGPDLKKNQTVMEKLASKIAPPATT